MYLSALDIQNMQGIRLEHFLNPNAICIDKSLGDVTGLRNLGVHMVVVEPGHRSTELHAHSFEEECVYVLAGRGTAILGDRTILIGPGDFLAYPANGVPHEIINEGSDPLIFLVVGHRLDHDVIDYPRQHRRLYRHHQETDVVQFGALEPAAGADTAGRPAEPVVPPANGFRLVPIDQNGRPDGPVPGLPKEAKDACDASAELYGQVGFVPPWTGYLAFMGDICVGTCAFKAPPKGNRVEIAYYTFPAYEGRGHATSMAIALMQIAFEVQPGIRLIAHTPAEESASTAVLSKLGFHLTGRGHDTDEGEVWEWMLQTAAS